MSIDWMRARDFIDEGDMMPPPELVKSSLKLCRCCPECAPDTPPCHGALVSGLCDQQRCTCNDDAPDDMDDDEDYEP
jgi:hypothetical protein